MPVYAALATRRIARNSISVTPYVEDIVTRTDKRGPTGEGTRERTVCRAVEIRELPIEGSDGGREGAEDDGGGQEEAA